MGAPGDSITLRSWRFDRETDRMASGTGHLGVRTLSMDHLRRELAPISNLGWEQIAEEATRVLKQRLAARRLVDFHDHHDWTLSAVPTGRISEQSAGEVQLARREVTDRKSVV